MDMCLEQTTKRAQNSSSGIIGSTRQKKYDAKWEINYHEMMAVNHLHRAISDVRNTVHELVVNHEFSQSGTESGKQNVQEIITYILAHEIPFDVDPKVPKLHYILTQEVVGSEISNQLLHVYAIGKQKYLSFRKERFLDKKKTKLSELFTAPT